MALVKTIIKLLLIGTLFIIAGCGGGGGSSASISGQVTIGGVGIQGVTITLSGDGSGTAVTDANGNYTFPGVEQGQYTIAPQLPNDPAYTGFSFTPLGRPVWITDIDAPGFNFNMVPPVRIAASGHTLYVDPATRTVWAWGHNDRGQLGNGATIDNPVPSQIAGLTDVIAVAAGADFSLALTSLASGGKVYAWGGNTYGQIGDGTNSDRALPVLVSGLGNVTAISAGAYHAAAVSGGAVYTWGLNNKGQLGDNSTTNRTTPVPIAPSLSTSIALTTVVSVAAGYDHTLARTSDSYVYAWGGNSSGQLGDTYNLTSDNFDGNGRIIGGTADSLVPIQLAINSSNTVIVTDIAAGYKTSVAVQYSTGTFTGTLYSWGLNDRGQLGVASIYDGARPVNITTISNTAINNVVTVSAGFKHMLVAKADGTVWAWGDNTYGQLGNGSTGGFSPIPVQASASNFTNIVRVAAGWDKTALTDKGSSTALKMHNALNTVWGWGDNSFGQLAGASNPQPTPLQIYP